MLRTEICTANQIIHRPPDITSIQWNLCTGNAVTSDEQS